MYCFQTFLGVLALAAVTTTSPINSRSASLSPSSNHTDGPDIVCENYEWEFTSLIGDGNPHQNFIYRQVSGQTLCTNNPGGSASVTESQTVGTSFSVGGAVDFITGGFDVSYSTTTGFTNTFG